MLSSVKIELFIKIAVCIIVVLIFNPMANIHLNVFNFFQLAYYSTTHIHVLYIGRLFS